MPDDVLTLKDVAEYLKVTERTIYRMVADRKIPAFKVGGSGRFGVEMPEDRMTIRERSETRPNNQWEPS